MAGGADAAHLLRSSSRPAAMRLAPFAARIALPLLLLAACRPTPAPTPTAGPTPTLEVQASGTTALLQAVSAVSDSVVWISGHAGTWGRTLNGGRTWETGRVAGADTLQFRDVHGVGADTAFLMSAGTGALSRIYRTTDGGRTWSLRHTNADTAGFYDCMAFWDGLEGYVYGDAVDGRLVVVATRDGGETWARVAADRLPAAQPGEGGFAASGTCAVAVTALGVERGWIATGNAPTARVLRSTDGGRTWSAAALPIPGGEARGATGVTFRDAYVGVAAGGDIGRRDAPAIPVATSGDGGVTWTAGGTPTIVGAAYGVAYVPQARRPTVLLVGPGGASWSPDDGRSWAPLDTAAYWALGTASPRSSWLVGPRGRIVRVRVE